MGFLNSYSCHAQPKVKGNAITYTLGNTSLKIYFCDEGMFRITKFQNSHKVNNEKWMVIKYKFPPVSFSVNGYDISTSRLKIHVDKSPWRISVMDHSGHRLYHELSSCYQDSVANEVAMNPDEHFFGFGERMDKLDQKGQRIYLNVGLGNGPEPAIGGKDILRANYCPIPFMISNQGYAIFFHTAMP
jgi:alpha-glucosidase (family GH31 glycosyl hydrolase)